MSTRVVSASGSVTLVSPPGVVTVMELLPIGVDGLPLCSGDTIDMACGVDTGVLYKADGVVTGILTAGGISWSDGLVSTATRVKLTEALFSVCASVVQYSISD